MKKLLALVIVVAAGAAAYSVTSGRHDDAEQFPAGIEHTTSADEAFVQIKYLAQDQASLLEHGFSSVATSVADYRERALEHLGRGESERALSLARQGRELASQTLGVAATGSPTAANAPRTATGEPSPPDRGGSLMTESMTAVDLTTTIAGATPEPRIRGARTKASSAAENLREQQSRAQQRYDDLSQ